MAGDGDSPSEAATKPRGGRAQSRNASPVDACGNARAVAEGRCDRVALDLDNPRKPPASLPTWTALTGFKSLREFMGQTWRQCPDCLCWRTDVRRDGMTGEREPCGECSTYEVGRCECCGYKHRDLRPPQEGGRDPLAALRRAIRHDRRGGKIASWDRV